MFALCQNPEIIFCNFCRSFKLYLIWTLMLHKCIYGSRYLVLRTPSIILIQSYWNFTCVSMMVWGNAYDFFQNSVIIFAFFSHFKRTLFPSSNTTYVYIRVQVPCPRNFSYSCNPIIFKFCRCFKDGLKISMCLV